MIDLTPQQLESMARDISADKDPNSARPLAAWALSLLAERDRLLAALRDSLSLAREGWSCAGEWSRARADYSKRYARLFGVLGANPMSLDANEEG